MSKFYIDNTSERKYYAYSYQNGKINYIPLKHDEVIALLKNCSRTTIKDVIEKENFKEIIFHDGISLIVDNLRALYPKHDRYDIYFQILIENIREFVAKENIKKYRQTLPSKHIPKVNRTKKNKLPAKQIIAGTLSLTISASLIAGLIQKEMKDTEELAKISSVTLPKTEKEVQPVEEMISYEVPDSIITLSFEDRTNSNKVDEETSKLEETNNYFGNFIAKYALRYGLPYDLISAQITQERPNIENGVCENVCQITYEYFVGQTLTVPVYNESGFTGNYDIFEVTKEMLDTPEGNIRVGVAYLRSCVDRFNSLITGLFVYNQGESTLGIACDYYGLEKEDYLGDENAIKARDLINRYYEEQGVSHGDKNYLENVFSYLELSDRSETTLEYFLGSEKKSVEIKNTLVYNNELAR